LIPAANFRDPFQRINRQHAYCALDKTWNDLSMMQQLELASKFMQDATHRGADRVVHVDKCDCVRQAVLRAVREIFVLRVKLMRAGLEAPDPSLANQVKDLIPTNLRPVLAQLEKMMEGKDAGEWGSTPHRRPIETKKRAE
jgi:hypothetical protein